MQAQVNELLGQSSDADTEAESDLDKELDALEHDILPDVPKSSQHDVTEPAAHVPAGGPAPIQAQATESIEEAATRPASSSAPIEASPAKVIMAADAPAEARAESALASAEVHAVRSLGAPVPTIYRPCACCQSAHDSVLRIKILIGVA